MNQQQAALHKFLAGFDTSMPTDAEWENMMKAMQEAVDFYRESHPAQGGDNE